jgi:four helix bundle protein
MRINCAKELTVYQKAYALAMDIFRLTMSFPAEERFALVSQIRRSSRSVCLNLREAWAKRRYEANFINKLTDCDGEINETGSSLDFARDCGFICTQDHARLTAVCTEVRRMLGAILNDPTPFLIRPD